MSYLDQKPLILNQLAQAKELLKQLGSDLDAAASTNVHLLVPIILSSFENSISMLGGIKSKTVNEPQTTEFPCWVNGSPRSNCVPSLSGNSDKKRKTVHRWTDQVRACEQTGLARPIEDGYSWRQYGKNDILGAKHPRCYYQCAHKNSQDCLAMKQVQRSNENTLIFNVEYRGKHTCNQATYLLALLPGQSGKRSDQQNEKRLQNSRETTINFQPENSRKTQTVLRSPSYSFPTVSIPIPCIERKSNNIFTSMTPDNHFMNCPFSSPYLSPSTSKSNSFSPYRMQDLQTSDYDLCEFPSTVFFY